MKLKAKLGACLLLLLYSSSYGQMEQYDFKRELQGISEQWHKVILPNEIFRKVSTDLSDIRIFGITSKKDTIEAPYILRLTSEKIGYSEVNFKLINQSRNNKGHYFTFEIPSENQINQIKLDFKKQNFDWRLKLEGSQNQQEWFTIVENYRLLSIINEFTDFQFTNVAFPSSRYRYFRVLLNSREEPELVMAKIALHEVVEGNYRNYPIKALKTDEKKQPKQTVIDIDLGSPVPVYYLKININNGFDYYRPVTVSYLTDSLKTQVGWKYNYSTLASGTLNSIEKNELLFKSTILQKLRIVIHNHDNEPLTIDSFTVKGYLNELVVRFTAPATYYLTYGNNKANIPHYDINRFSDKVPDNLTVLKLGVEELIEKKETSKREPLFKNKLWLWAIMAIIIGTLGWFTVKMIRGN